MPGGYCCWLRSGPLRPAAEWNNQGRGHVKRAPSAVADAGNEATARSAALLNSAVLYLGVCLGVGVLLGLPDATYHRSLPLLLGVEGGLALWLSLALGVQWLFYGVLGLWGVAAALVKLTYFPASGSGLTMMGVALLIWAVLWWVERAPVEVATLRQERAALREARAASLTLLWYFPVTFQPPQTVVRVPLQQAMVLVWSLGVVRLGWRLLGGTLGWSWPVSAMLGTLVAVLITGSLAWPWLLPVAMTLGLGAWLVTAYKLGVTTVVGLSVGGAAYAVLVWRLGVVLLAQPTVRTSRTRVPSAWGPYTAGAHNALDSLYDDGVEPGYTTRAVWGVYPPGGFRPDPRDRHGVLGPGSPALSATFAQVSGNRERHAGGCVDLQLGLACPAGALLARWQAL